MQDNPTEAELTSIINYYEGQCKALIKLYGTGVRPSWVSTELAIFTLQAERFRKMLNDMRGTQ